MCVGSDVSEHMPAYKLDGIAARLGVTARDFPVRLLDEGAKVELEHTGDWVTARKIALDHLAEDLDYYKKLKKMEHSTKRRRGPR